MVTKKMTSEQVIEDLQDFAKKPQGFAVFVGKNGRGKTYAATKIYERVSPYKLPARDYDIAWIVTQADLNMLFADNEFSKANLAHRAKETKLFVLDDLGTRSPSEAFLDFLYAVIDYRWQHRGSKGTIITTNMDSTQMRERFGDAVFSRMASGRNYVFSGVDRRFGDLGF